MERKKINVFPIIPVIIKKDERSLLYIKPTNDLLIRINNRDEVDIFIEGNFEKEYDLKNVGSLKIINDDGIRTIVRNGYNEDLLNYRYPPRTDTFSIVISSEKDTLKIDNLGSKPLNVIITNR